MSVSSPSLGSRFGDCRVEPRERGFVRAPAEHDGIGNALRAIYDDRLFGSRLPDDMAGLLDRLR